MCNVYEVGSKPNVLYGFLPAAQCCDLSRNLAQTHTYSQLTDARTNQIQHANLFTFHILIQFSSLGKCFFVTIVELFRDTLQYLDVTMVEFKIQPVSYKRYFRFNNCFLLLVYTIHLSLSTNLVDPPPMGTIYMKHPLFVYNKISFFFRYLLYCTYLNVF